MPVTALTVNEPTNDFGASNEITNESLAYQTKPMLIELAEEMEIAGVNPTMTKSAIITAIMAAVNPLEETEDTPSGVQ